MMSNNISSSNNKNKVKNQQDEYLLFLEKMKLIKQAELAETNRRLAASQISPKNKQLGVKELSNVILSYYSNLDETQKKSIERTLTLNRTDKYKQVKKTGPQLNLYTKTVAKQRTKTENNNYTSEEYGDWLKTKSNVNSDTEATGKFN